MLRSACPLVLLAAASLAACVPPEEDESQSGEGAIGQRAGAEQLPTTEPGISLLDGYATLFDIQRTRCVTSDGGEPLVGQPTSTTTVRQVKTESELATELGLDATLSVKAPTASGSATASMLRSFKSTSNTVNFLVKTVHQYVVTQRGDTILTDRALDWMRESPSEFLHRCGDRFVGSVTFEARVNALITYETNSEERALALQSEITGSGGLGEAVAVDGSLKARLSNAAKQNNVRTSLQVVAQGFAGVETDSLSGLAADLDQKLAKLEEVGRSIGPSLAHDRQNDLEGYSSNRGRSAIPASLTLIRYSRALNAPPASERAFAPHFETLRRTEAFLRAFGQLELAMDRAYKNEIVPFLNAGPNGQAEYNLVPPARPVRFARELEPIAHAWAARFRTSEGVEAGSEIQAVRDVIAACVDGAKDGSYEACHLAVEDASTLPRWRAGREALDEYKRTGRIAKLTAYVLDPGKTKSYRDALAACNDIDGWVDRLPTEGEAELLAPLVAGYGGGIDKTIWITDTADCKYDPGLLTPSGQSFFTNPIDGGDARTGCKPYRTLDPGRHATVCVGQRGPLGKLIEL